MTIGMDTIFNNENPICHINISFSMIPYLLKKVVIFPARLVGHYASVWSILLIWFFATLITGRGWCSWICFYGGWEDGVSRMAKKPRVKIDNKNDTVRYFSFAMLAFLVLATLLTLTSVYCEWFCPFKLITEYMAVDSLIDFIATIIFIVAFFGLVIVMPFLTRKRFQCMTFCPFGAFQSLLDKVSFYKVSIDTDKCTKCMRCVSICPTMSITEESIKKGSPILTCTKCGECIDICPQNAIHYSFRMSKLPKIGFWEGLSKKFEMKKGMINSVLAYVFKMLDNIFSPKTWFIFSAYIFGIVISSTFSVSTIYRLINLVQNGSFLLK